MTTTDLIHDLKLQRLSAAEQVGALHEQAATDRATRAERIQRLVANELRLEVIRDALDVLEASGTRAAVNAAFERQAACLVAAQLALQQPIKFYLALREVDMWADIITLCGDATADA